MEVSDRSGRGEDMTRVSTREKGNARSSKRRNSRDRTAVDAPCCRVSALLAWSMLCTMPSYRISDLEIRLSFLP